MWEFLTSNSFLTGFIAGAVIFGFAGIALGFARGAQAGWENAVDDILGGRVKKEDIT